MVFFDWLCVSVCCGVCWFALLFIRFDVVFFGLLCFSLCCGVCWVVFLFVRFAVMFFGSLCDSVGCGVFSLSFYCLFCFGVVFFVLLCFRFAVVFVGLRCYLCSSYETSKKYKPCFSCCLRALFNGRPWELRGIT